MEPHKLDQAWIRQQLNQLPLEQRKTAQQGYQVTYKAAYEAESVEHMKSNAARRAANTRLREYVKKVLAMR